MLLGDIGIQKSLSVAERVVLLTDFCLWVERALRLRHLGRSSEVEMIK